MSQMEAARARELALAPARGSEDPEDGADALMARVDHPGWGIEALIEDTLLRAQGLPSLARELWLCNLFEFSIYQTGTLPERLALAQALIERGLCDPVRSSRACSLGSVAHIAAEGASMDGLNFALACDPEGALMQFGTWMQTPLHCAAVRDDPGAPKIIERLARFGVNARARCEDGRCALFRSFHAPVTRALLRAGADPNSLSDGGASPLATMLFFGSFEPAWALARAGAHLGAPVKANESTLTQGKSDHCARLPLSHYARSERARADPHLVANTLKLVSLGADPFAPDPDGQRAWEAFPAKARSQMEALLLARETEGRGSASGQARSL